MVPWAKDLSQALLVALQFPFGNNVFLTVASFSGHTSTQCKTSWLYSYIFIYIWYLHCFHQAFHIPFPSLHSMTMSSWIIWIIHLLSAQSSHLTEKRKTNTKKQTCLYFLPNCKSLKFPYHPMLLSCLYSLHYSLVQQLWDAPFHDCSPISCSLISHKLFCISVKCMLLSYL